MKRILDMLYTQLNSLKVEGKYSKEYLKGYLHALCDLKSIYEIEEDNSNE